MTETQPEQCTSKSAKRLLRRVNTGRWAARKGKREIYLACKVAWNQGKFTLDEILELLEKTTKRTQKNLDDSKESAQRQSAAYEQILQNQDATQEQRLRSFMGRMIAYDRMDRLSAQLSLLYTLQIFAFKVKVLEVSVEKIDEQLEKSGVLAKGNEIADIRKHIDALKILVEAQYESLKEIKEKGQDLPYIM